MQTIDRAYAISISGLVVAGVDSPLFGGNCVVLDGHGRIATGRAVASWEPTTPAQEFELAVMTPDGTVVDRVTGASEAVLVLDGLLLDGRGSPDAFVFVQLPRQALAGPAFLHPALIDFQFTFVREPDSPSLQMEDGWGCWTES